MEKRKIEVVKLGEKHPTNVHDDRISIEFSPSEIEWMGFAFMKTGKRDREIFKILKEAHGVWEKKRSEVDQGSTP